MSRKVATRAEAGPGAPPSKSASTNRMASSTSVGTLEIFGRLASRRKLGQHHRHQHECRSGLNAGKGRLLSSSVARRAWNTATACCFSQENECVPPGSVKSAEPLDIGRFQYPSAGRPRSALLQELDSSDVFGSPTWARTRDLRINSRPLDLPATPHECSALWVLVSNTSCLLHLSNAPGRPDLKHWILEASNCWFHASERASTTRSGWVGALRQDGREAPNGALVSGALPADRNEERGGVGGPRWRRELW